jgi:hypothetical protein
VNRLHIASAIPYLNSVLVGVKKSDLLPKKRKEKS